MGVEQLGGDRHVAVGGAALRRGGDPPHDEVHDAPSGVSTVKGEPSVKVVGLRIALVGKVPSRPSCAGVAGLPACQLMWITRLMSGATPVT